MASPLVETKLFVPALRRGLVGRPRRSERLSRGVESRLTLVSAPAGFGKTTLVSAWLAGTGVAKSSVAWVSLDESDSQAAVFWTYVISALQRVAPEVGASVLPALRSAQPPIEAVLATVVNELSAAWELSVGVYMVVKGFRPSPITATTVPAAPQPSLTVA